MTKKELAKVTRARYGLVNKSVKTFMLDELKNCPFKKQELQEIQQILP